MCAATAPAYETEQSMLYRNAVLKGHMNPIVQTGYWLKYRYRPLPSYKVVAEDGTVTEVEGPIPKAPWATFTKIIKVTWKDLQYGFRLFMIDFKRGFTYDVLRTVGRVLLWLVLLPFRVLSFIWFIWSLVVAACAAIVLGIVRFFFGLLLVLFVTSVLAPAVIGLFV